MFLFGVETHLQKFPKSNNRSNVYMQSISIGSVVVHWIYGNNRRECYINKRLGFALYSAYDMSAKNTELFITILVSNNCKTL